MEKISIDELGLNPITNDFMKKFTPFSSLDDLFRQSNFQKTYDNSNSLGSLEELDKFISNTTQFSSWSELKHKAFAEYYSSK